MDRHPDDHLPELALGILEGDDRPSVEAHVRACERCAVRLKELSQHLAPTADSPATAPPLGAVRLKLAAAIGGQTADFVQRMADLLDISAAKATALLDLVTDRSCWSAGSAPGVEIFPVMPGKRRRRATAMMLKAKGGARVPRHQHAGTEQVLVFYGSFRDDSGVHAGPGDLVIMPPGSEHEVEVLEPCMCVVLTEPP